MVKYISATGNIKTANKLSRVIGGIITATGSTATAVFRSGGAGGVTVADIRVVTSGNSFQFKFDTHLLADHVTLTNCVLMLDIKPR
jgi:hypothetical protein